MGILYCFLFMLLACLLVKVVKCCVRTEALNWGGEESSSPASFHVIQKLCTSSPADRSPGLPTQLGVSESVCIMFFIQLWDVEITV